MTAMSLFDVTPEPARVFASTPGPSRHENPDTSKDAGEKIGFRSGALKHRILATLAVNPEGLNDYALHAHCDPLGRVHSAATRRKELADCGLVVATDRTAPTDVPGNEGHVHEITEAGRAVLARLEETHD